MKKTKEFLSIRITRFFMKSVGFWPPSSRVEKLLLNGILCYTLCALASALLIEVTEFYLSMGDIHTIIYTACSTMPVILILMKMYCFLNNRKELLDILKYTEDNFWYAQYDEYGKALLREIDKKGVILISTFTFFIKWTVFTYMLSPIIGILILKLQNVGKNESDRKLPFNIWLGSATTTSPTFEIIFFIEVLSLIHSGLCFCCFDNLLGLLNINIAGQFKLLQHRLETIVERILSTDSTESFHRKRKQDKFYEEIRKCVISYHELISYSEKTTGFFMFTTLCQLIISSILLCVTGFQVFLARGILVRRMIFISHMAGCTCQLFFVTFTANDIVEQSRAVGYAAYNTNWQVLPHKVNKKVRNAILMIMVRSTRACSISAGGFFPVSLETFMMVVSSAASYFTLLRRFVE
ncbi:OrJ1 [Eciton burchellii]|nr:OrJ1 [Eciton burchellii]